jgi:hypothetical protein
MALGSEIDGKIVKLLSGSPMTATRLGKELNVDNGALTIHLFNGRLRKEGLIEVVGADGSSPVWGLTDAGREYREGLGYP